MRTALVGFLILLVTGVVIAVGFSAFIVPQTHRALVLQFGEPVRAIDKPGLYWRMPFVQTVVQFDRRILDLQTEEQEVIAADQKRLIVDAFARYRISDPLAFYRAFRNEIAARQRLTAIVDSTIRSVLGRATFIDLVRNQREGLMKQTLAFVNNDVRGFGVDVVDVRIRRADLPEANSQAIFRRMQTERQREAAELRAQGAEQAQRIRSTADKEVTVVTANANRDGERTRGEGDAERNRIYADAFGRDRDFFAFYRSMQAYEESLKGNQTRIVVSPSSEFFRYFNDPMSAAPEAMRTPSPAGQTGSSAAAATPAVR
ncbi:protease modulator HflC [Rhodomicrobium sp. Az07]|uniref:protease modulator HflC n=1 Tax=Rhodomicrobium sp. Az07 TaxID=2839034 RepID=UPI001BE4FA88|nr:protease modulator HflC [Rhodomicrobium sp. Az07]MBT3070334.1 protease modulator HflC [Rhodomicrobium sp. Az07]